MSLERVISGGQTGVEQAAWRAAAASGVPTGGTMPRGFRTEAGYRPDFAERYGAVEHERHEYRPAGLANVEAADGTLWVGSVDSAAVDEMRRAAADRPGGHTLLVAFRGVTQPEDVRAWIAEKGVRVLNVAGSKESSSRGVGRRVEQFLRDVFAAYTEHHEASHSRESSGIARA